MQPKKLKLSLKCEFHQSQPVMGVCMKTECPSENRLVCFECLIDVKSDHHSHSSNIISLNQIDSEGKTSGNWPQDPEGAAIRGLLQSLQRIKSKMDIEQIFEDFKKKLCLKIDNVSSDIVKVYTDQEKESAKFICNLESEYENVFSLSRIVMLLDEYEKGNINKFELHQNINAFVNSDEKNSSIIALRDLAQKQNELKFISFDEELFEKCSKECINSIQQFSKSFKSSADINSVVFEIAPVKSPDTAKLLVEGTQKWIQQSHSVVYVNTPLKHGTYKIKVRLDSHTSGCYVVGMEKEGSLLTSNYWTVGVPACCLTCKAQDALSMVTNTEGQYIGNHLQPGKILVIDICLKKNIFNVGVEGSTVFYKLNQFAFEEGSKWRLYFNNYSGQPSSFQFISSIYSE